MKRLPVDRRGLLALTLALALPSRPAFPEEAEDAAASEAIRPFDRIILKNGNALDGTTGPVDLSVMPEVEIELKGGGRTKVKRDDIEDFVPRQTAEDVYKKKSKRVEGVHDPAKRAPAELALGIWCRTPLAENEGASPREEAALEHLMNAVEIDSSLKEAYPHLLAALAARGELEAAAGADLEREVRVARLASAGGYDDPDVDFRAGVLLAGRLGLREQAIPHLERAAAGKNLGNARKARAWLAGIHSRAGDFARALAVYEPLAAGAGADALTFEACYELARLHARQGDAASIQKAREFFGRAQALQPDFGELQAEVAALDYREGLYPAADKALKAIVTQDPANVDAACDLALVRLRAGLASAEKSLRDLLPRAAGPAKARLHLGLGVLRERRGDAAGAAAEYAAAVAADPASVEARAALALAHVQAKKLDEARAIARELLSLSPAQPALIAAGSRLLAEADLAEGKPAEALAHFGRAVEVEAADAALLERTGLLLLSAGKLDRGAEFLRRARERGGDRPDLLNGLAYCHYARGELAEADKLFEQVLKLVPAPKRAAKTGPAPPLPPARAYAQTARTALAEIRDLEVFTADLKGPDAPLIDGWREPSGERYGIVMGRQEGRIVFSGKQAVEPDAITSLTLDRPIEVNSFERVAMRARPGAGRFRMGLRLDGRSTKSAATAGIVFYKDLDGILRCQVKGTQGDWDSPALTAGEPPETGRPGAAPPKSWPEDGAFHTLEIRKAGRKSQNVRAAGGYDLYLDGELLMWNVKVPGLGGQSYDAGISGQTDQLGNEYSFVVESFQIYRERPQRRAHARF
jgi:tetratricopeptide (TPR) repeat protein